jgi:hypothetical protein
VRRPPLHKAPVAYKGPVDDCNIMGVISQKNIPESPNKNKEIYQCTVEVDSGDCCCCCCPLTANHFPFVAAAVSVAARLSVSSSDVTLASESAPTASLRLNVSELELVGLLLAELNSSAVDGGDGTGTGGGTGGGIGRFVSMCSGSGAVARISARFRRDLYRESFLSAFWDFSFCMKG